MAPAPSEAVVSVLKSVVSSPQQLHHPSVSFFKTFLESLGAELPPPPPRPAAAPHPELRDDACVEDDDPEDFPPPAGPAKEEYSEAEIEAAGAAKEAAAAAVAAGDWASALAAFTSALAVRRRRVAHARRRGRAGLGALSGARAERVAPSPSPRADHPLRAAPGAPRRGARQALLPAGRHRGRHRGAG